jgi:hypothetical protein
MTEALFRFGRGPLPLAAGEQSTIPVPTPPSAATECPNGNWSVRLTSLTYSDVSLHIQQPAGVEILTFNFGTIDP